MSEAWTEGMCNESTGFLFRHPCQNFARNRCAACSKRICDDHTSLVEGVAYCPACGQAESRRRGIAPDRGRGDDDTYYDGGTYYSGYGHHRPGRWGHAHSHGGRVEPNDPDDLQAGDAESLRTEGDEGFEVDMSES